MDQSWNYCNRPSKTDPLKLIYIIFLYFRKYQGFNKINVLLSPTQSADSNYDVGWFSNCHVSELLNIWQDDLADYVFLFDHETEWHRSEDDQIVIQNRSRKLSLGKLILNSFWSLLSPDWPLPLITMSTSGQLKIIWRVQSWKWRTRSSFMFSCNQNQLLQLS